jgi:hypothetical protein
MCIELFLVSQERDNFHGWNLKNIKIEFLAMFQFESTSFIMIWLLIPEATWKWYLGRLFPLIKCIIKDYIRQSSIR